MFLPIRFKTNIELTPHDLTDDFNVIIKNKLQKKLEGICTRYGYIKPGSLEIIKRSYGKFIKQHFNGHIYFDILCKGEVCNPPKGLIVEAQVKNKNTLGLLAEGMMEVDNEKIPILDIIIPKKAAGILSEINIDEVQTGDIINVMIMGKRFQLNDSKISIIGKAVLQKNAQESPESDEPDLEKEGEFEQEEGDISDIESVEEDDEKDEGSDDEVKGGKLQISKIKKIIIADDVPADEIGGDDDDDDEEDDDDFEEDGGDEEEDGGSVGGDIYYDE